MPPLRERGDDVAELAHHFLFLFNRDFGLGYHGFDPETLACLQAYPWPGNVRELQGVLKEAMLRTRRAVAAAAGAAARRCARLARMSPRRQQLRQAKRRAWTCCG